LANHAISIEAIVQKEPLKGETSLPIILLTQQTLEREMNAAIAQMEALPTVMGKVNRIRLETLG
jgi:homoserine dehydrogenase